MTESLSTCHTASIGDTITIKGIEGDAEPTRYLIVDRFVEVITAESPVGAALLGAVAGETVGFDHLGRHRTLTVVDVDSQS